MELINTLQLIDVILQIIFWLTVIFFSFRLGVDLGKARKKSEEEVKEEGKTLDEITLNIITREKARMDFDRFLRDRKSPEDPFIR